jgi:hypothetical protein
MSNLYLSSNCLDKVKIREVLKKVKEMMEENKNISPEFTAMLTLLLSMFELVLTFIKIPKNRQNSDIPPSKDVPL